MAPTCGSCWRQFPAGYHARDAHCNATGHWPPRFECDTCSEYFQDEYDRRDHMDYAEHWEVNAPKCPVCYDRFPTQSELDDHVIQIHRYCTECMRFFRTPAAIRQHLNSGRHRTTAVRCPFCEKTRGTATGLVHHVERGCCHKAPADRMKLYQSVRQRDPYNHITIKSLEWYADLTYEATENSWNTRCNAYECYLCHSLFHDLGKLNHHLSSPRHLAKLYHCPGKICQREFTTLAALINHLENESCGYMRFQAVQVGVGDIINPGRRIEL